MGFFGFILLGFFSSLNIYCISLAKYWKFAAIISLHTFSAHPSYSFDDRNVRSLTIIPKVPDSLFTFSQLFWLGNIGFFISSSLIILSSLPLIHILNPSTDTLTLIIVLFRTKIFFWFFISFTPLYFLFFCRGFIFFPLLLLLQLLLKAFLSWVL